MTDALVCQIWTDLRLKKLGQKAKSNQDGEGDARATDTARR